MKYVLPGILFLFFIIKDVLILRYFPDMATAAGEWDGANAMTMDMYSVGLFLSYVLSRCFCHDKKVNVIIDVLIGIAGCDLYDRLFLHATEKSEHDQFTFWCTFTWVLSDYYLPEIKKLYGRFRK